MGSSDSLNLFAFDAGSGEEIWRFQTGGWSWNTPVVTDDAVYIGAISAYPYYMEGITLQQGVYAIDKHTGQEKWHLVTDLIDGYITGWSELRAGQFSGYCRPWRWCRQHYQ